MYVQATCYVVHEIVHVQLYNMFLLVEVGFGDGDEVSVHCSLDGYEGRLASQRREGATELSRVRHIQQVLYTCIHIYTDTHCDTWTSNALL